MLLELPGRGTMLLLLLLEHAGRGMMPLLLLLLLLLKALSPISQRGR